MKMFWLFDGKYQNVKYLNIKRAFQLINMESKGTHSTLYDKDVDNDDDLGILYRA